MVNEARTVPAVNIKGNWYITLAGYKVKLRDVLTAFGYTRIGWDEESQTVTAGR